MSQDIYIMVKRMNFQNFEIQLALQCAPLIAGLKVSNLFIIKLSEMVAFKEVIQGTDISWYCLMTDKQKVTLLLFRKEEYSKYLADKAVQKILAQFGYTELMMEKVLKEFKTRYFNCIRLGYAFPHEMGVLLGYPIEDVQGFITHRGKDFLHSGYWKVYDKLPEKLSLFQQYDHAMESVIHYLYYGINIVDILNIYKQKGRIGT